MSLDYCVVTTEFERHWKNGEYKEGLSLYYYADRPFWLTEDVGRYYEDSGQLEKAVVEYEYLISEYEKIRPDFLPLPCGPAELVKLGKWYASKNPVKAKKYLKLYLSAAEVWKTDSALHLPHKTEARRILSKLKAMK